MTIEDFRDQFDTLANSYANTQIFGAAHYGPLVFDDYEKSVFLTLSQENVLKTYYSSETDAAFEQTEEARRALDSLVQTMVLTAPEGGVHQLRQGEVHTTFIIPECVWYIIYEEALFGDGSGECTDGNAALVVPTTHDTFYRTVRNPFRGPNGNRVLRLNAGHWNREEGIKNNEEIELVANSPIQEYRLRYIKRPSPIILRKLPDGLTIQGKDGPSECKLHDSLHGIILTNAVTMAISSRSTGQTESKKKSS